MVATLAPAARRGPRLTPARDRARFRTWPLAAVVLGYPVWWVLGLSNVIPLLAAIPMAAQLVRHRDLRLPRGAMWWALFLVWLVASGLMLLVDAPYAVPGGSASRILVYAYRLAWYAACTVVLVWLGNADPNEVPTRRVVDLIAWMFVITVAGGLLGTFAPTFELRSLMEIVLPHGLTSSSFVHELIHPAAADKSTFLGYVQYRPIAPFDYANTWGASFAFTLPFFVTSWLRRGAGWRRGAAPVVLLLGIPPVVYSLNRALWAALVVVGLYVIARLALRGHLRAFVLSVAILATAAGVFVASPFAHDIEVRLQHAHSNERRAELLDTTVASTLEGSPIVGFGNTRDPQGNFASIAGGSTPDCPDCGVPPLGTQGLVWTVLFSQGVPGLAFFLLFFLRRARTHWRSRTPVESVAVASIIFFLIALTVYDVLGIPMLVVMAALGLAWREARLTHTESDHLLATAVGRIRAAWVPIVALACVGAVVGAAIAVHEPQMYAAKASLLLAPVPVSLNPNTPTERRSGAITIDTEAALVVSADTLDVLTRDPAEQQRLRSHIAITAPPNTDVINIEYRDTDPRRAERTADAIATSYLAVRADYLALRRDQVLRSLDEQLAQLLNASPAAGRPGGVTYSESKIREYMDTIELTPTAAGEELRAPVSKRVRTQVEVPLVSAALLGLLAGLVVAASTGWRGTPSLRRPARRAAAQPTRSRKRHDS